MTTLPRRRFVQRAVVAVAALSMRHWALADIRHGGEAGEQIGARLDAAAVRKLAAAITGQLITTNAPDYESSRLIFNRAFDKRPALIVRCAAATDIAHSLEFAQRHDLPAAVRGGGHNRAGLSICDGGVVIDLSAMNRIEVNSAGRLARAEAGALTVHVDAATQRFGLATTLAGCPTVGIAGLTLGGGEGFLMSKYGLACDNLASAQLLTVDGRQVEVSLTANPDLFWAIRGGGGNFGVAWALEYRLHPVSVVLAGTLVYPVGEIRQRLEVLAQVVASAPDEFNVVGVVSASAQGPRFHIIVGHCGDPRQGNDLLNPLRALNPEKDTVRTMSYLEANATINPAAPVAHFQTDLFVPQLTAAVIETIATAIDAAPPNSRVFMVPIYGAVTRVGPSDTAYPLRRTGCELDLMARWDAPSDKDAAVQWVKALRDKLRPFATGAYVNQLGETSDELVRTAYGANYSRLVAIKKKYDPNNVLQSNQNIRPS
jgi:FAD/FMN-containing dehydrogenase